MTKFFVDDADQTMIVCPKCGFTNTIDTTNHKETQKRLKANCKCCEVFKFTLELRKYYSKDVRLPGEYTVRKSREKGESISLRSGLPKPGRKSSKSIKNLSILRID